MGSLFSCCKEDEILTQPLNRNMHCFVCGECFNSPYGYNKHIPTCNKVKNT
jgi:hypothetical protein